MKTFRSDVSGKTFPVSEKVSGKVVRNGVLKEILKANSQFSEHSSIAISELNRYRHKYIENLVAREVGTLTELEQTVLENIQFDQLLADEASDVKQNQLTTAQQWADRLTSFGGSWTFVFSFGTFILLWIVLNIYALNNKSYDPYPFILLNLILSCVAAVQAPVIMMSQKRMEEKDRQRARNDYMINLKSELEVRMLHEKMDQVILTQQENLMEIQQLQADLINDIIRKMDGNKSVTNNN